MRRWFYLWCDNGLWLSLNHALRLMGGREASPRAYDAGKKIKRGERCILTDTDGKLVGAAFHTADNYDRVEAPLVLAKTVRRSP